MAHFLTLVLVERMPPRPEVRAHPQARQLLSPYCHTYPRPDSPHHQYKCDYWSIGGRYDGLIFSKEQHYNCTPSEHQERYGLQVIKPEPVENIRLVAELPEALAQHVYALVTPDGAWLDCEDKTHDEWRNKFTSIMEKHSTL